MVVCPVYGLAGKLMVLSCLCIYRVRNAEVGGVKFAV
jgi:hypothetical protein